MARASKFIPASKPSSDISVSRKDVPCRVVDIILSENHPAFKDYGDIGAIRYRRLDSSGKESDLQSLPIAYPLSRSFFTFPFLNEVVYIHIGPQSQDRSERGDTNKTYYTTPIAIWNHPHFNGHPDPDTYDGTIDLGIGVEERGDIPPLLPFPGDLLIEGRFGQSIRMTGARSNSQPLVGEDNNGRALTILKNGKPVETNDDGTEQIELIADGYTPIVEDINTTPASIYLTEDHILPLEVANDLRNSYLRTPPIDPNVYRGAQVVLNANRVVINSKEDSTLISGNESVSLASNAIHMDGEERIVIDSKKIFLGRNAYAFQNSPRRNGGIDGIEDSQQPVVLGGKAEEALYQILAILRDLIDAMALPERSPTYIPNLIAAATAEKEALEVLETLIPEIKSKKVFTE